MTLATAFLLGIAAGIFLGACIGVVGYRRGLRLQGNFSAADIAAASRLALDFHLRSR